jgi:hypothetical protein
MDPLACGIVAHFIGDYLLQNDYLAQNKKKSSWVCGAHCLLYGLATFLCLLPSGASFAIAPVVALLHFPIDRWQFVPFYMRYYGQNDFAKPPCFPWSVFWVDNTMHLLVLWASIAILN